MVHRRRSPRVRLHRPGDRSLVAEGNFLTHSVVIVSYRPTDRLGACLESVLGQSVDRGQAVEVLVVDNASPGEAATRIAARHGVKSVRLPSNVGFSVGANEGARQVHGEVIAFLNDDARAGSDWLRSASAALEDPTVAAVGPKIVLSGRFLEISLNDEPWWAGGDPRPLGRRLDSVTLNGKEVLAYLLGPGIHRLESQQTDGRNGHGTSWRWRWTTGRPHPFYVPLPAGHGHVELTVNGEPLRPSRVVDLVNSLGSYLRSDGYVGDIGANRADDENYDTWEERFALTGTALVTTRAALDKVGPFEPRYFAFYEDIDWCWRARLQGYRFLFDPSVSVRHERGARSGGMLSRHVQFLQERNRLLTLLRNAPAGLATRETWKKRHIPAEDGVAAVIPRFLPRVLAERALFSRAWVLSPREVAERWAGVDVPLELPG
jgi:GT2 family glycosyltransferase